MLSETEEGGFFVKKALIAGFMGILAFLGMQNLVLADEYGSYQDIVFEEDGSKLLKDFTTGDYDGYYGCFAKNYFMGWRVLVATEDQKVDFVSETKLKVYNSGYSTIKHEITLKSSVETQFQINATGSLSVNHKGGEKKFSGGLDADIKATVDYEKKTTASEEYVFKINVDPGTYVTIVTMGEGIVNNGVAKHYFFWILTKKGGWETFTVTTEYYEIIKERLG
jgi:hypothetical protein